MGQIRVYTVDVDPPKKIVDGEEQRVSMMNEVLN